MGNRRVSLPAPGDPRVVAYLVRQKAWRTESERLRAFARDSGLLESFKWGHPCYALGEGNVALIHGFKSYVALLFFKGALMKDEAGLLVRQTPNVQAARQLRFTDLAEVEARAHAIKAYLNEAIEIERAGAKVGPAPPKAPPPEFAQRLVADPELAAAFDALTPGRRRAYCLHFAGARQAATRAARIERWRSAILAGKGIDD